MSTPRWMGIVVFAAACCPDRPAAQQPSYAPPGPAAPATATAPQATQPTTAPPATTNVAASPALPAPQPAAAPPAPPDKPTKEAGVAEKAPPPKPPAGNPDGKPDGEACSSSKECKSGVCEGQGCGYNAGKCMPQNRMCTRDLVMYCACNGETFGASGSCPGRLYRARGECKK